MLILFYNSFFGVQLPPVDCGAACTFTADRRLMADADVVVFHLPGAREIGDARKYPGQTWVAWSMESSVHTPMVGQPELMRHFDLTMTFSRKSDVWCGYLARKSAWDEALARPLQPRRHKAPLVMFQSATADQCGRNAFCAELMQLLPVDSYGKFLKNREIENDRGPETKNEVIGGYKFALGAENTFEPDYVTEKFFQPLLAGSVPVYRGARTSPTTPRATTASSTSTRSPRRPSLPTTFAISTTTMPSTRNTSPGGPGRFARASCNCSGSARPKPSAASPNSSRAAPARLETAH